MNNAALLMLNLQSYDLSGLTGLVVVVVALAIIAILHYMDVF